MTTNPSQEKPHLRTAYGGSFTGSHRTLLIIKDKVI